MPAAGNLRASTAPLEPALTPHGHLVLAPADDTPALPPDLSRRLAVEGTTSLGYPADSVVWIGAIELVCLVFYLVHRARHSSGRC